MEVDALDERSAGNRKKNFHCFCGKVLKDTLIFCCGPNCAYEWFHMKCGGLKEIPTKDERVFCSDKCKEDDRVLEEYNRKIDEEAKAQERDDYDPYEYCSCKKQLGGDMVKCSRRGCEIGWYHLECANLTEVPQKFWYCEACSRKTKEASVDPSLFRFDPNFDAAFVIEESASSADESRPESVIQNRDVTSKLYKIGSNHLFADVFFITSDGKQIPSHRNILAGSSNILMQIFKESTEIPVQIDADGFDADTIESALNFLYEKPDAINGKEMDVFKFAVKYGIDDLIEACYLFFDASVDVSNVCEFIQIAYSNDFNELKQKCLKVLVQGKDEIDPDEIAELPKNILFDAFCFKL